MSFNETFQKQLVERYDRRSRYFSQLFMATTVFALGFLAFILVPLVGLQHEEVRISKELKLNEAEQTARRAEVQRVTKIKGDATARLAERMASHAVLERRLTELEGQSENLAARIDQTELEINKKTQELGLLDEQRADFDGFRSLADNLPGLDVDKFVVELQEFLRQAGDVIRGEGPTEDLGIEIDCPRGFEERSDCVVKAKVMQMLSVHDKAVRETIVVPVRAVDASVADDLEGRLDEAFANFNGILAQRPDFWRAVTLKHHVGEQFRNIVEGLSHDIDKAIQAKIQGLDILVQENAAARAEMLDAGKELDRQLSELQVSRDGVRDEAIAIEGEANATKTKAVEIEREIASLITEIEREQQKVGRLSARQAKIALDKTAITDRLENVESPFGTLPVGLAEALQVFPIILAVGMIMVGLVLAELIRLRRGYHALLQKKFPDEQAQIDLSMTLITPLFLDPCRPISSNGWRTLVLALPIAVYIAAIVLVSYSWSLDGEVEGMSRAIESGYMLIYLIFAMLFILPVIHLVREWRRYIAALAGTPPTAASRRSA